MVPTLVSHWTWPTERATRSCRSHGILLATVAMRLWYQPLCLTEHGTQRGQLGVAVSMECCYQPSILVRTLFLTECGGFTNRFLLHIVIDTCNLQWWWLLPDCWAPVFVQCVDVRAPVEMATRGCHLCSLYLTDSYGTNMACHDAINLGCGDGNSGLPSP